jgi:tripeptide aminopeptidase
MQTSLETLAGWGFEDLSRVVAIDSSSDEKSTTIPSTEGQRRLSAALAQHFERLGFSTERDAFANLIVHIPATPDREAAPATAFMVHMDTAHGTQALEKLDVVHRWDGGRIKYQKNPRLHVDAETYPMLLAFVGDDVVHGPGDFPFGLDDKLGMSELMTLGRVLAAERELPHGELFFVFRPDEEIGRMEAVTGLAAELARRGVQRGYTVDGLAPFEVNVENFDAARARVRIAGKPLAVEGTRLRIAITGVNTHGATAKSEGYLNSTVVFARALRGLPGVVPLAFASDGLLECNAVIDLAVADDAAQERALSAFEREIGPARRRGADVRVVERGPVGAANDAAARMLALLRAFLESRGPTPLLSEDSSGHEGYTNPHRAVPEGDALVVDFRLRDFTKAALDARAAHVQAAATSAGLSAEVVAQYVNMGPVLARYPELPRAAEDAARAAGFTPVRQPIRGGTGVDPFLDKGIPVANLGTGYFAPESEKELTSKQNIARHVIWLAHLVQRL